MRRAFVCTVLVLRALSALANAADLPETTQAPAARQWAPPYPHPIGAAIQGLASGSTDVIVADVLETSPLKALEGARDNMKLKVVEVLMGHPIPEETIDLYYHLRWIDEESRTLEPPKFEYGKRYVVFLKSHFQTSGDGHRKLLYELADQWLSVMPQRPGQAAEIAAAIRVAHGDARGAWSESVGPLRGRLVAYRSAPSGQTPVITCQLDLSNVTGGDNTVEFDLSGAVFTWEVADENGKPMAPAASSVDDPAILRQQRVVLEAHATARLPLSPWGGEIAKDRQGYLSLMPGKAWTFEGRDETTYFLSGTIEVPFRAKNVWYGTLKLPRLPIPID